MSKHTKLVILISITALACTTMHAGSETTYWAMLTGINEYSAEYGVSSLNACVDDVDDMYNVLRQDSTRWQSSKMTKYTDSDATKSAIQSAFTTMASSMDENDVLLYFQSSHGGQIGGYDSYLCMHDADYTDTEMASDLTQFADNVKVIIILDACFSGGMFKDDGSVPAWNFASNVMSKFNTELREKGRANKGADIAWMTAADYNEMCAETSSGGIFTTYVVQGLEGEAETSGDGYISFMEAFDYAKPLASIENSGQTAQSYNDDVLSSTIAVEASGSTSPGTNTTTTTTTTTSTTTSTTSSGGGSPIDVPNPTTDITENFTRAKINDFNGDSVSDLAVYDNVNSTWYIATSSDSLLAWDLECGWSSCLPVSGDYNGDGKCDIALFDSANCSWYSMTLTGTTNMWDMSSGTMGDTPVNGDYDGDGRDDLAVFDSTTGAWYVLEPDGTTILKWGLQWGWNGAIPVSGDFNGDSKSDYGIFDDTTGQWYILTSEESVVAWAQQWGWAGAVPVSGDYDGDGRDDLTVFDDVNGYWYVMALTGRIIVWGTQWGWDGAIPVSGDYNGDGRCDLTVYDDVNGYWYSMSTDGTVLMWAKSWGWSGANIVAR